jgi:hypothetical protein
VDAADWVIWRKNFAAGAAAAGSGSVTAATSLAMPAEDSPDAAAQPPAAAADLSELPPLVRATTRDAERNHRGRIDHLIGTRGLVHDQTSEVLRRRNIELFDRVYAALAADSPQDPENALENCYSLAPSPHTHSTDMAWDDVIQTVAANLRSFGG